MVKSRKAAIVSGFLALVTGAWNGAQFLFDAASTPENTSKLWNALMSAPQFIPWLAFASCMAVLTWSVWPVKKAVSPIALTDADRLYQEELARLQAIERAKKAMRVQRLIGSSFSDVFEEMEKDRKAEAEAKRLRMIREASAPPKRTGTSWIPLHQALYHLVYDSEWAMQHGPLDASDDVIKVFDETVGAEVRERLARGEIAARGRYGIAEGPAQRATEPIPAEFWIDAFLQPHGEIALADDNRCVATKSGGGGASYCGIILRGEDVSTVWPAHSGDLTSPFISVVEGYRASIAAEQTKRAIPILDPTTEQLWEELESDRIRFVMLRERARGYHLDLSRANPDASNLAYEIEGALRQAAVDGDLTVWGRKYRGPVHDNEPLVQIPAQHFEDYSFGHGCLHYETTNEHSHTGRISKRLEEMTGEVFFDLYLSYKETRAVLAQVAKGKVVAKAS